MFEKSKISLSKLAQTAIPTSLTDMDAELFAHEQRQAKTRRLGKL